MNPPEAGKYSYWTNDTRPDSPDAWAEDAVEMAGSWWPDWQRWVTAQGASQGGERAPARHPGDGGLRLIEDAPGSYVRVRIS